MRTASGIAAGFVAGFAVAGGAFLMLRDSTARTREEERIAQLDVEIQRLESEVSRLSALAPAAAAARPVGPRHVVAQPATAASRDGTDDEAEQARAINSADALVDRAIQSGQWTHEQAKELVAATAGLPAKEQGRIHARISAAINAGQLQVELP